MKVERKGKGTGRKKAKKPKDDSLPFESDDVAALKGEMEGEDDAENTGDKGGQNIKKRDRMEER